ncbi:MAG: PUR family DNA/RNA-binding protein [Bacteroidales bacterium]|nr:PUR family DNA/RNA-binding protein [Bacteroidales bacterium]
MEETDNRQQREEIFSVVIRAGKRTYFFDVKETRAKEKYLTITESKRRFSNDSAKFFYEKHKIFLYQEDFEKFSEGFAEVIDFIKTGKKSEYRHYDESGFDDERTEFGAKDEGKSFDFDGSDADDLENDGEAKDQDDEDKF